MNHLEDISQDGSEPAVRMTPLFSGSGGNATFLQFGSMNLLVDIGCSCKRITEAMNGIGQRPEDLHAIFITHDHGDHIQGLEVFSRRYHIPVFASERTWNGIRAFSRNNIDADLGNIFKEDQSFCYRGLEVYPFSTPHDSAGSVGYRFSQNGTIISITTDLGWFSESVKDAVWGSQAILIEANYSYKMLWDGPYPWSLKKRIGSKNGHLCNRDCALGISQLIGGGTKHFILGHLSEENNTPGTARSEVEGFLQNQDLNNGKDYTLFIARRNKTSDSLVMKNDGSFYQDKISGSDESEETINLNQTTKARKGPYKKQLDIFQILQQMEKDGVEVYGKIRKGDLD